MHDLADAHAFLEPIAATRRSRGRLVTDQHLQRAAALLVDLWAAASPHGITPDEPGYHTHLPRAAFDTTAAAIRAEHGWTIHTKRDAAHGRGHGRDDSERAGSDEAITPPSHRWSGDRAWRSRQQQRTGH